MKQYRVSAWFAAVVSVILILRGLITSVSSTDLDVTTLIIGNILPLILLYVAICLLKTKERRSSATSASVLASVSSVLWLISLIPGLPVMLTVLLVAINFFVLLAALLTINWPIGRGVGLAITIIILLIGAIFVGAYGASTFSSSMPLPVNSPSE